MEGNWSFLHEESSCASHVMKKKFRKKIKNPYSHHSLDDYSTTRFMSNFG